LTGNQPVAAARASLLIVGGITVVAKVSVEVKFSGKISSEWVNDSVISAVSAPSVSLVNIFNNVSGSKISDQNFNCVNSSSAVRVSVRGGDRVISAECAVLRVRCVRIAFLNVSVSISPRPRECDNVTWEIQVGHGNLRSDRNGGGCEFARGLRYVNNFISTRFAVGYINVLVRDDRGCDSVSVRCPLSDVCSWSYWARRAH
jgi:hypothetical protein